MLWVKCDSAENIDCWHYGMQYWKVVGSSVDQIWLKQDSSLSLDTAPLSFPQEQLFSCSMDSQSLWHPSSNGNNIFTAEYGHWHTHTHTHIPSLSLSFCLPSQEQHYSCSMDLCTPPPPPAPLPPRKLSRSRRILTHAHIHALKMNLNMNTHTQGETHPLQW